MDDRWHPQIGDPTAIGWITVLAYAGAALLCAAAQRRDRDGPAPRFFWLAVTLLLVLLGINKQLDLQSLLTQVMRDRAKSHGWYEQRREYQALFISAIAAIGALLSAALPYVMRRQPGARNIALAGLVFLYCFILVRASSFHHVDWALSQTIFCVRLNWMIEIGGIVIVAAGAILALRRAHRRR
ncbi:hypothetical protein K7957_17100 [Sphingomonas yunnanensis]|uniref:hypothetical protein n=1 Tax=Sphingomonas yunnanensis TaxID=310400 RepID=UPI001CA63CC5|nr:hypothetical protein [Sphingomonas yunnanensis]MBY9064657.1 hypothetical protein [Sphingomonas yunnanensis]